MDPNEALRLLRFYIKQLRVEAQAVGSDLTGAGFTMKQHALDIAETFEGLDEWMTSGGFVPAGWGVIKGSQESYQKLVDFARALYWDEVTHPVAAAQKVLTDIGEEMIPRA